MVGVEVVALCLLAGERSDAGGDAEKRRRAATQRVTHATRIAQSVAHVTQRGTQRDAERDARDAQRGASEVASDATASVSDARNARNDSYAHDAGRAGRDRD